MGTNELKAQLEAARSRRKPVPSLDAKKAEAEEFSLRAALVAELRALREEENADLVAKYAPTKTRRFFDFDPDGEHPAIAERDGKSFTLHTRFVVRGANADQLEKHGDAITVRGLNADGRPDVNIDAAKMQAVVNECAVSCIVYPVAAAGVSAEQHRADVEASLWYLGAARAEVGKAAIELGGVDAAARRSKS